MNTEIIKITSTSDINGLDTIYGLGKDQRIYYWNITEERWFIYSKHNHD